SLRWCRLEAGARRNEEEQPAGWGGFLALLTVLSSPVRVGRLAMLSVPDKSLSQDEEALERREHPSAFRRRESQVCQRFSRWATLPSGVNS
ncbi:MAG TPA: hypothetical protein VHZ51_21645, partial [Ktedonobacteraceae bacterium]|nr:hypothetical protein [Ktedonobacteraceae bacterium]